MNRSGAAKTFTVTLKNREGNVGTVKREEKDAVLRQVNNNALALRGQAKRALENGRGDGVGSFRANPKRGDTVQQHIVEDLWAGFGTLGSQGSPLGFGGSYEQAAALIDKYIDIGVDGFVLSSTPALEEAFRVGEEVLPLVRGRTAAPLRAQA